MGGVNPPYLDQLGGVPLWGNLLGGVPLGGVPGAEGAGSELVEGVGPPKAASSGGPRRGGRKIPEDAIRPIASN